MRTAVSALAVAVLLPFALAASPGGAQTERKILASNGVRRSYSLFVPEGLRAPAPLLLLFHGSGRNATSIVEPWKTFATRQGIVLAALDAADVQVWQVRDDGPVVIRDLVEGLKAAHPIDSRRVYLFGHSGGAVHALNIAMLESEYFAAAAIHAGAWRNETDLKLPNYSSRPIPVTIVVGDRDELFPLEAVNATSAALKAKGNPANVIVLKGHNHDYYRISAEVNTIVWEALGQVALSREPKFTEYQTATR